MTAGLQIIEGLAVSRDGQWLAFDSNLSGNQDIYGMRLPDGEPEQVTTDPADEFIPNWSPDATMLAFHGWQRGNRDIFVIGTDGRDRQQVTSLPGHEWYELVARRLPDSLHRQRVEPSRVRHRWPAAVRHAGGEAG